MIAVMQGFDIIDCISYNGDGILDFLPPKFDPKQ